MLLSCLFSSSMKPFSNKGQIFRKFMKGKFDAYVLWPLAKRFQFWIVDRSTAHDFTVCTLFSTKFMRSNLFLIQKSFHKNITWNALTETLYFIFISLFYTSCLYSEMIDWRVHYHKVTGLENWRLVVLETGVHFRQQLE